ncbi:MAG: Rossmann fold domain-containing protein [Novosphingobium sp.]
MLFRVGPLPEHPLDAASVFHAAILPRLRAAEGTVITCLFDPADHAHGDWRKAAIRCLARNMAPRRINAIVSDDAAATAAAEAWLAIAEGITGQYLSLDSAGAGKVLG